MRLELLMRAGKGRKDTHCVYHLQETMQKVVSILNHIITASRAINNLVPQLTLASFVTVTVKLVNVTTCKSPLHVTLTYKPSRCRRW